MAYIKNIRIKQTIAKAINYVCDVNKTKEEMLSRGNNSERNMQTNPSSSADDVGRAMNYIANSRKTMGGELVDCNFGDWRCADQLWKETRQRYNKDSGVLAHHFVQSFDPIHGVTPQEAHAVGIELAEKMFGSKGYDYIVATHMDKEHIHNHILVNNVARRGERAGYKFPETDAMYRKIRKENIEIARDHGIPAMDCRRTDEEYLRTHPWKRTKGEEVNPQLNMGKTYNSTSYIKTRAYTSWEQEQVSNMTLIRKDIDEQILHSRNWDEFVANMEQIGYQVSWKKKNGELKKNVTYKPKKAERGRRDSKLGKRYTREGIMKRIEKHLQDKEVDNLFRPFEPQQGVTLHNESETKDSKVSVKVKAKVKWKIKENTTWWVNYNDPHFIVKKTRRGKHYLVPRSCLDQMVMEWIAQTKAKDKAFIESGGIYSNYKDGNISKGLDMDKLTESQREMLRSMEAYVNRSVNTQNVIARYHIKNVDDLLSARTEKFIEKETLNNEIAKDKKDLLEVEKILDLFQSREKYKAIYDEYVTMEDGKDKQAFHDKYKKHIQNYAYDVRSLDMLGVSDEQEKEYKDKQFLLLMRLDEKAKKLDDVEKDIKNIGNAEQDIRNLFARREKRKAVIKRPAKEKGISFNRDNGK